MFDDLFKMFKPFPPIKVTKRDSTVAFRQYAYDFEVEYNGNIHRMTFTRYPHIYKNERAWLWSKKSAFKRSVKKKGGKKRERPTGKAFIL